MGLGAAKRESDVRAWGHLAPPLKWAGGKRWLLSRLTPLFDRHRNSRLVEPFVGGMAVALGLEPRRALLNDVNPHLINFYLRLREGFCISRRLKNDRAFFLRQRSRFNRLISRGAADSAQAAELFYYLNRTGFNGLCRFNRRGEFNVPFGRYATINYLRDFGAYAEAFAAWDFSCGDFESVRLRRSDFVYVDPPYDVEFTTYSAGGFDWADQERLVEWLVHHRGPTVVSNQATPRIVRLYRRAGFEITKLSAPRMISCNGDRARACEMLATRNV